MAAEIAIAAAGMVLSPYLQMFFERMSSGEFDNFFQGRKLNDGLLMKLKIKLLSMNAVVEDAEDKQFTKPDVKGWLDELKDAAYDAEDVLDVIATKALQLKSDAELGTFGSKVRNPISTSRFIKKVEKRIEEILDKMDFLVKEKVNLGLREGVEVGGNPSERLPTTSLIQESSICGRNDDKKAIINSLLYDDASGSEIGVIAIVGMGGIGKTTLTQLVYNDTRVKEHFDLKVWICVSDPFDVFIVMKTILDIITPPPCDIKDQNQLQIKLHDIKDLNQLQIKLNDIKDLNQLQIKPSDIKDLNQLQIKLKEMLIGKKFLLVLDDVWDKTHAKWETLSNALKFGAQGSKVIVTTRDFEVARVMHASATHHILELLKEDCWSLFAKYAFHDGNSNAYPELEAIGRKIVEKCKGLPLAIKAIGALLWSKLDVNEWENVLRSELWDLPIEEIGIIPALRLSYKYLSPHLKRCFTYCSIFPKDYVFKKDKLVLLWIAEGFLPQLKNKTMEEVGDDYFRALVSRSLFQQSNRDEYIMHDLVNDLAKFISKQFTLSLADDCPPEITSNTRHLSFHENFASFQEAKRLRTVLELNLLRKSISQTQFPLLMTRCLRVLILSYHEITKLPNSIGKLIHLRYLDLSYTNIKRLPDSICKLCNLQILNLSHCWPLAALPRDMHKLINLRHLDITGTYLLKEMPRHLGRLKGLQTLTKFIVGKHRGSGMEELKKLTNLRWRGSLSIENLQNVRSPTDAKDLNLRDMKYLEELELDWGFEYLEELELHCPNNAKDIERQIVVLDSLQPHSNLKSLAIRRYKGKSFPDWVGHPSFSNITSLHLSLCSNCCILPPLGQLPSLEKLVILFCDEVESFSEGGLPPNLNEISIFGCEKLFASRMGWGLQKLSCLRRFTIWGIDVESFPDEGLLPTSLTFLCIESFRNLKYLDKKGLQHLTALEELEIRWCPKLKCMPEDGLPASLSTLRIDECPLLEKEWERKEGEEWRKIAHVPNKYIHYDTRIE